MSSPAMSSSRRFILQRMRMKMTSSAKPYPIGIDHTRKQRPEDLRSNRLSLLSRLSRRVRFLINNISDLDTAAKHARLVVSKKIDPERAIPTCNAIIGAMCDAKRSDDALDLFHFFFNESKMKPNIASCNLIIKSHCEHGRLDDALRLYSHLSSSDNNTPSPDHNTYDLLTKALVDAGMMDQALDFLLRGRNELFNFQEPAMYMNLIRGFLEQGNLDMAYQLRDDFKTCSTRPKIEILNSAFVEHLFKQGKDEEAMELYSRSVNKDGFTANGAVGKAYLKVLLKYGKKTQAWALFQYMLDNYHRCFGLDVDTLNMMVNECFEVGRFTDALNIFIKTKAKLEYLPVGAYRNLITRFCQNGMLYEAEKVFDELLKERFKEPDAATYTSLIHAYVEAGRAEDAVQTANMMIASNLQDVTEIFF